MPRGEGMMAPSAYDGPTLSRMSDESVRSLVLRRLTLLTTLASISSAKESNVPPLGVRKLIAARERRRSFFGAAKDGRYHATTFIPRACAASMNRDWADGRTTSTDWL